MGGKPRPLVLRKQTSKIGWIPKRDRSIDSILLEYSGDPMQAPNELVGDDKHEFWRPARRVIMTVTIEVTELPEGKP